MWKKRRERQGAYQQAVGEPASEKWTAVKVLQCRWNFSSGGGEVRATF
jgi:hypothetical protein